MMYNTFNMGIGMILAVEAADAARCLDAVRGSGQEAYVIGAIEEGEKGILLC